MSAAELRAILEVIAQSGSNPERINAVKQLQDLIAADDRERQDSARLDPSAIASHLAQYDGRPATGAELDAVLDALCSTLCVTADDVRRYRRPAPEPIPTITAQDADTDQDLVNIEQI